MSKLAQNINRQARHNLLFTANEEKDIVYIDIGRLLATDIEGCLQKRRLGMIAEDALRKILLRSFNANEEIGEYLALKNIGILFEPALQMDVKTLLSTWSRDHILIIKHEGSVRNGVFYLSPNSTKYSVNLNDITYKSL